MEIIIEGFNKLNQVLSHKDNIGTQFAYHKRQWRFKKSIEAIQLQLQLLNILNAVNSIKKRNKNDGEQ
jgi:hypothetical protein